MLTNNEEILHMRGNNQVMKRLWQVAWLGPEYTEKEPDVDVQVDAVSVASSDNIRDEIRLTTHGQLWWDRD